MIVFFATIDGGLKPLGGKIKRNSPSRCLRPLIPTNTTEGEFLPDPNKYGAISGETKVNAVWRKSFFLSISFVVFLLKYILALFLDKKVQFSSFSNWPLKTGSLRASRHMKLETLPSPQHLGDCIRSCTVPTLPMISALPSLRFNRLSTKMDGIGPRFVL